MLSSTIGIVWYFRFFLGWSIGGTRRRDRAWISRVLCPSLPLHLLLGQSDAGAETATWVIQQPCRTSLVIVLILFRANPGGWSNLLKNPLWPQSEVIISAPESDWPGGRRGGKEGRSTRQIEALGGDRRPRGGPLNARTRPWKNQSIRFSAHLLIQVSPWKMSSRLLLLKYWNENRFCHFNQVSN